MNDTEELFFLTVTDVVEHEDGGATYSFDLSEGAKDQLAKLGLEWVLHCAAFGWDLQDALDNLKRPKDLWQPYNTAPKDGQMILVCLPRMMNLIVRARFNTVHKYWQHDYEGEGAVSQYFSLHPGDVWMPMPEAPKGDTCGRN